MTDKAALPLKKHERCPTRIPDHGPQPIVMLFKLMRARKLTVPDVSKLSGVAERTMRDWRDGKPAIVPNLEAALNSMGYELVALPRGSRVIADP